MLHLALILPYFAGVTDVYLAEAIADITSATMATCLMLYHLPRILSQREQQLAAHQGD